MEGEPNPNEDNNSDRGKNKHKPHYPHHGPNTSRNNKPPSRDYSMHHPHQNTTYFRGSDPSLYSQPPPAFTSLAVRPDLNNTRLPNPPRSANSMHHPNQDTTYFRGSDPSVYSQPPPALTSLAVRPDFNNTRLPNPPRSANTLHHPNQDTTYFRGPDPSVYSQPPPALTSLAVRPDLINTRLPNPPRSANSRQGHYRHDNEKHEYKHERNPYHIKRGNSRNANENPQEPRFHIGFKFLENIIKIEDHDKALKEIVANRTKLFEYLDTPFSLDNCNKYVLLLKVFEKINQSALTELKSQVLIEMGKIKFTESLELYFKKLAYEYHTDWHKNRNQYFWTEPLEFWNNFLTFCECILVLSPNYAFEKCRPLIKIATKVCIPALSSNHDIKLPEEYNRRFAEMMKKFSVHEKRACAKRLKHGDCDDYGPVPDDFRELNVFPRPGDLLESKPFVRPNIINGSYESVEHYLDVQFRLLREDCYGPLRIGIEQFRKDPSQKLYNKIRVYRNARMIAPMMTSNQFGVLVQWDESKNLSKKIQWAQSKKLMDGCLLVFVRNNFKEIIIATVLNRDEKFLSEGLVGAQLYDEDISDRRLYNVTYDMLEYQVYFEHYLHVLRALQDPEFSQHFAMSKYIINVNHAPSPPAYQMLPEQVNFTVLDEKIWLEPYKEQFDESQYEAYKRALTQEFVVIQGPPGSGKTYLGTKIAETLLNMQSEYGGSPSDEQHDNKEEPKDVETLLESMKNKLTTPKFSCCLLYLSHTDHALDQFLEKIIRTTDSVVRIGGQCKNKKLDSFDLTTKRKVDIKYSQAFRMITSDLENSNAFLAVCQKNINTFKEGVYTYDSIKTVCRDVEILENYEGDSKDALINWLFEHANDYRRKINPDSFNKQDEKNKSDEPAQFKFDHIGIDEERRLAYEKESLVQAGFLIEKVSKTLADLSTSYIETGGNGVDRYKIDEEITYHQSRLCLFQEMVNKIGQFPKLSIKTKNKCNLFSTEERWRIYFEWAATLKEKLKIEFQKNKEKHEKKFEASQEARMLMDLQLLRKARVVGVTTTGAAKIRKLLQAMRTPIVIVEEAAEIMEAHITSALTKDCQHLILIGDHQQLRPSAANYKLAKEYNIEVSLFERMVMTGAHACRLRLQHRMRPEIAALISPAIYSDLQNHPSVFEYKDVKGLTKNLFFFTHNNREEFEEKGIGRNNNFEADMLLRLANYLMQQGYKSDDITILTTYSSQMYCMMNNRSKYSHLQDTKITIVDKYQGEECKIILLSLVRNNEEGNVGFLATDSRVCVALSRAKEGMYIMGNIEMLKKKSELWTKIAATLEANGSLGQSFTTRCQNHPLNVNEISCAEDFLKVPEGGCAQKCMGQMNCGHACLKLCHSYDRLHTKIKCNEKCSRVLCQLNHMCPNNCSEKCAPCKVILTKELPCGHTKELFCHVEPNDPNVRCYVELTVTLPVCKHQAKKKCYEDLKTMRCPEKCQARLKCGHTCRLLCHKIKDPEHEQYKCEADCPKTKLECSAVFADGDVVGEHKCLKMCYEQCDPCVVKVLKKHINCIHKSMIECSKDVSENPCENVCDRALPCTHFCKKKCFEPCNEQQCTQMVKKIVSDCGHEVSVPCNVIPTRLECDQICQKKLACGHNCTKKCFEDCDCEKNTKLSSVLLCGHSNIICHLYLKGLKNQDPVALLAGCAEPCGTVLACGHMCAGRCGRCRQGRLHVPCAEPCGRTLICGHVCEETCNNGCPPCSKQCEVACLHNRCPEKCGVPCVECKEPCGRACQHGQCWRTCGAPCAVPPCDERCPRKLECGHRCVGLCGEPCPPLCPTCRTDDLPPSLLGGYDEDELFIVLKDCGHSIAVAEADMMMQVKPDGEVTVRACPACRKPIINTSRYKDIVNQTFKEEINPIKRKIYGDEAQIRKIREDFELKFEKVAKINQDIIKPHHEKIFKYGNDILNYLDKNKKLSVTNLTVINIVIDNFEIIHKYIEQYNNILKGLTEREKEKKRHKEYFLDLINVLLSCLTDNLKTISEQRQRDVNNEIRRVRCVVQLATLEAAENYRSSEHQPAVRTAAASAAAAVTTWRVFDESAAVNALKGLEVAIKANGIVTKAERDLVVKALGMPKGHWFKCPNGHFYCIGECGGAMERGRCPDCRATIGGTSHRLDNSNRHAPEIDGSRYPAWSDQANIAYFNQN